MIPGEESKNTSSEPTPSGQTPRSAVIIVNPASGGYIYHAHQVEEALAFLREAGWEVALQLTKETGDASRLVRQAVAQKIDVVIAAGGDGTINEVIQELAGSETALGVLPFGTVNVWARETNIPLDISSARKVLLDGVQRYVDLGKVNDRYFLLMTGIGFDADVANAVEKKPIKHLGVLGYLLVGTWFMLGYQSFRVHVTINGRLKKRNALQIVVGNTQLYAGAIKYTWNAKCDDGLLDVCIVRKRSILGRFVVILDFLFNREQRMQWVSYEKCTALEVRTRKPIAIQVDGDPCGYTPARFTIAPRALKVILPQHTPPAIFS